MYMFIKSLLFAFSLSAIIGPTSMLCIQKTLAHGMRRGLAIGCGSASIQAFYGLIASIGIGFLATVFTRFQLYIKIGGGIFLIYFGYTLVRKAIRSKSCAHIDTSSWLKDYFTTLGVSSTNPIIILMFFSFFTGLGITTFASTQIITIVLGIFLGSMLWWITFSFVLSLIKHKISSIWIDRINKASGVFIGLMGLWNIIKVVV